MPRASKRIVAEVERLFSRPMPPKEMAHIGMGLAAQAFVPAPELHDWIRAAYLDEAGPLHDHDHDHLREASIGCLWTNVENSRALRRIVAMAEMPERANRAGKWARARAYQQLCEWFDHAPDFLLTFDAVYGAEIDDASFCALVDHELRHCAQDVDEFGQPKFSRSTGQPIFTIRGHDVEEFVGVVRRFGAPAAGVQSMVEAAAKRPEIAAGKIAQACGTCMGRAA